MTVKLREKTSLLDPPLKGRFFNDEYASVSFIDSVPCIKVKISGVPHCSEHYQFVQSKIIESIYAERERYCRLHLLTDSTKAGIVLPEDVAFYQDRVIPELEKAGIRYHAIVLPESSLVRMFLADIKMSTKRIEVGYFNSVGGASKWLRHR